MRALVRAISDLTRSVAGGLGIPMTELMHPGSDQARRAGCTCSMIMNFYGRGWGEPNNRQFEVREDCPLHAPGRIRPKAAR